MFRFFFLLLLLILLPDLYIWWNYTRLHEGFIRTAILLLPSVLVIACMILLFCQVRAAMLMQWAFILIICITIPKLVFVLTDLIGRGVTFHWPIAQPYVHKVSIVLAVLMAAVQVYGLSPIHI